MQAHDRIVKELNEEFKKVDRAFETNEMRVFGKNTAHIFKELDVLRRKQLDIASYHVTLETLQDTPSTNTTTTATPTSTQWENLNQDDDSFAMNFERKEHFLKTMKHKASIRDTFRKISESEYDGEDTLLMSENEDSGDDENTSKRNHTIRQKQHQHSNKNNDNFLTVPATNTSTNTSSIL
ncbi:hypothetical protein [Parasitella parasitica]|uniref:Uncharacterized protein n=1 Tax=Parasitella parasitica TaxID=35722 RepID=A0A0B7NFA5_9FUNG|nr:hypothetical protein [Parasitella parasitica]